MKKVMAAEEAKAAEDMASFWAVLEGYKNIGDVNDLDLMVPKRNPLPSFWITIPDWAKPTKFHLQINSLAANLLKLWKM